MSEKKKIDERLARGRGRRHFADVKAYDVGAQVAPVDAIGARRRQAAAHGVLHLRLAQGPRVQVHPRHQAGREALIGIQTVVGVLLLPNRKRKGGGGGEERRKENKKSMNKNDED